MGIEAAILGHAYYAYDTVKVQGQYGIRSDPYRKRIVMPSLARHLRYVRFRIRTPGFSSTGAEP